MEQIEPTLAEWLQIAGRVGIVSLGLFVVWAWWNFCDWYIEKLK